MSGNKLILVTGATGAQGGSVVDALLADGHWSIRALTRNPESPNAKSLAAKGVEVLKGDVTNEEDLNKAVKGVYGFFAMTNFWDPSAMGKEIELGKRMVDIAKVARVTHFLWSTLANVANISHNKWNVPHFTDKAIVEDYVRKAGFKYTTFPAPAAYYTNFTNFFKPKEENGVLVFSLPQEEDKKYTSYDVADTGAAVVTALNHPDDWNGKVIALAGEHMFPQDYVSIFSKVTGKKARYQSVPVDVWEKFPFPGAKEIAHMFGYFNEYTYFGPDSDLSAGKRANPNIKSWEQWLRVSGWKGE